MTREEAIKELSYIADEMPSMECADWKEAIYMAIKSLEQEDILDKIRAEIVEAQKFAFISNEEYEGLRIALNIIDKYKSESEDKE